MFGPITDKNVEQVKTLNRSIFPVKYNDKFYTEVQKSGEHTQVCCASRRRITRPMYSIYTRPYSGCMRVCLLGKAT